MKTAFIIFDEMTALDFVGIYDPLTRLKSMDILPDFEWQVCAHREEVVRDGRGLQLVADVAGESLQGFDIVVVPGGIGTRQLMHDSEFLDWLRTASKVKLKVSVCTGALLLGAAGFLRGKRATTHPRSLAELSEYCSEVVDERIVDAGDVITAGGVTSAIDLGLYLVERLAGSNAKARISAQMDYPYFPAQPSSGN